MSTSDESLKETGRCAAAAIVEMVAALECDYDRLEELAENELAYKTAVENYQEKMTDWQANADAIEALDEMAELRAAAGECTSREDAETRITEDALSVLVRPGWYAPGDAGGKGCSNCGVQELVPAEFEILLSTGGPASRIRGKLDNGEPCRAWLEVQDWGTPWTQHFDIDQDTLLSYARCFYFGEG